MKYYTLRVLTKQCLLRLKNGYKEWQDLEKSGFNGSLPTVTLATASAKIMIVAVTKQKQTRQPTKAAKGLAQAPARTYRELGAELLYKLCNTSNPEEADRLAKQLDAHLMKGN